MGLDLDLFYFVNLRKVAVEFLEADVVERLVLLYGQLLLKLRLSSLFSFGGYLINLTLFRILFLLDFTVLFCDVRVSIGF